MTKRKPKLTKVEKLQERIRAELSADTPKRAVDLARIFGVSPRTIYRRSKQMPDVCAFTGLGGGLLLRHPVALRKSAPRDKVEA